MSDSGSESSSSEEFDEGRRSATPDSVASQSPRRSPHSDRKSPSTEASYQARSPASPLSGRGSKSPRSTAPSIKSPGRSSPKSIRSPSNSPVSSRSSQKSRSPSPKTYHYNETAESPRSNRSSPPQSNPSSPQRISNQSSPHNRSNPNSPHNRSNRSSPHIRSNRSSSSQPGSNRSSPQLASPVSPRPSSNRSSSRPRSNRSSPELRSNRSSSRPRSNRSSPEPRSNRSYSRPRSNRSSPQSPDNCRFQRCGPMSPKSPRTGGSLSGPTSPASPHMRDDVSGPASPTFGDRSPKSPLDHNSESRPSSPKSPRSPRSPVTPRSPRSPSPRSRRSSAKSPVSERNSSKSPKSPRSDRHSTKRSPPHSPEDKRNSFNELDGEQISDGDMDDVSQSALKSKPAAPITHGEDLSDVSDLDSIEDDTDREQTRKKIEEEKAEQIQNTISEKKDREEKIAPVSLTEENEQLDFESDGQWKDEREDGETESLPIKESKESKDKEPKEKDKAKANESGEINDKEDGEEDDGKVESELEEGELSDGDEARPEETEPRPICRFYNRGQCTWGVSCRFLHPGVTDKGNYTMFDMVRPMAYPPHPGAPHEFRPHIERPTLMRPLPGFSAPPHVPKVEDLASESPWERGLRQAKEMMRKANKRKESDMDFEEKKMNLSLGQEELDREAGYYVRPASPEPPVERWPPREPPPRVSRTAAPRITPDQYVDEPEGYYPPTPHEYYRRVHYKSENRSGVEYRERFDYHSIPPRTTPHSSSPPPHPRERERERDRERDREREREYYEKYEKKHKRPSREVIVERIPSSKTWREEEPPLVERGRGDEWADPWMRRKSPGSVRRNRASSRRSRRQSYSSGSSYSSSSSSRSSSHSSYTSYDSQSRSRSPSPPSRSRANVKTKVPTTPPTAVAPPLRGAMLMNPPAPSPRGIKGSISPTGTLHRRAGLNPPAPSPLSVHPRHSDKTRDKAALAAAAVAKVIKNQSRSRSSHSSSGSDSSGSSSDSSESSYSSSSSETRKKKGSTPPIRKDSKALDALKISGAKQQIKLTLKPTHGVTAVKKVDRSATIAGKKRVAESPPISDNKASVAAAAAKAAKKASSRREELLKQLKAVEDAIARKRSKV